MSMSSSNSKIKVQYQPTSQPQLTRERSDDNLLHRGLNARRASLNAAACAASGLASALNSGSKWPKTRQKLGYKTRKIV